MEAISTQKFVRMSPIKLRFVADGVRGKSVNEVLEILPFVNKAGAPIIRKVVNSAMASAVAKGANPGDLVVKSIEINDGPKLKRFRPVSRGQAHGYVRKMSHVIVKVATLRAEPQEKKAKVEKKKTVERKKK
jgi:large subunit ribosomal protein L22